MDEYNAKSALILQMQLRNNYTKNILKTRNMEVSFTQIVLQHDPVAF